MDLALGLEHEVRKAQGNKESVAAVFIDIRKASDMLWIKGSLIKLNKLGINGKMFRWIKDFLDSRTIQVRIGKVCSNRYLVENGTPRGSVVSPLQFLTMTDEVFAQLENGLGRSLFADNGAI